MSVALFYPRGSAGTPIIVFVPVHPVGLFIAWWVIMVVIQHRLSSPNQHDTLAVAIRQCYNDETFTA